MTLEEAIQEFDKVSSQYIDQSWGCLWGLEFYMYGQYGIAHHHNYEHDLNEHPWRYHLKAVFSLSSANAGIFYRTDDPVEGILKLTKYMQEHPEEIQAWGVNKRLDLGTPNDLR